jgi:SelR domain
MTMRIDKTEQEWREELSPERYHVLREKGTEPPFTGEYTYSKEEGVYRCGACGNELFSSDTKFDSGTGWPSFTEPALAEAVELHPGTRVRRRPRPDRQALLHQLLRARPLVGSLIAARPGANVPEAAP